MLSIIRAFDVIPMQKFSKGTVGSASKYQGLEREKEAKQWEEE
jgi:hypothetical protein